MTARLIALAAAALLAGCASTPRGGTPQPQRALPDARDLAEHPLDVLAMPQL